MVSRRRAAPQGPDLGTRKQLFMYVLAGGLVTLKYASRMR